MVHPGATVTERTPESLALRAERAGGSRGNERRRRLSIGRLVTAEEVATVVAFLASPNSVALNGDAITASGGNVGPIYD